MSLIIFRYEVFTGRCLLAVLDHNFHLFRKTIDGKFKKLYSKRSGNWRAEAVKEDKTYSYWPALIAEILCKRAEDQETAARHVTVSPTNPQHLAPTIAMRGVACYWRFGRCKIVKVQTADIKEIRVNPCDDNRPFYRSVLSYLAFECKSG